MGFSIPSERQLADAIETLTPGSFERLVECYLQTREPQRFRDLSIIGRNPDDVTRKGWPDAEVRRPDGRIDCVEVTRATKWRQHLRTDLRRIQELGSRIASFLLVVWADQPSREEEQSWREQIAACGISSQEVRFLFRKQLLFELRSPRYARLWTDPLQLPITIYPFVDVDRAYQLFGLDRFPSHFSPSRTEFLEGRVHRPQLQDIVEQRLTTSGWAFVRGKGASGKTTLATSIALSQADRPSYYIDLTDWDAANESRAIDTLLTRADDLVLFIVDNVHLEPEFTRRLFDVWHQASNSSHLLLLGRETTPHKPHRGHAHPLGEFETDALRLQVQAADLLGIHRRLLQRLHPDRVPQAPSNHIVSNWLRLFGGDLLAFSTAVANRAAALSQGDFLLRAEDARDYISREYLHGLESAEGEALNFLAVLAEIEIPATVASIGGYFPTVSIERGLVLHTSALHDTPAKLRLVHPGMGHLLLAAAAEPLDRMKLLRKAAIADSAIGMEIVKRLRNLGRYENARHILRDVFAQDNWHSVPLTPTDLNVTARLLGRTGVLRTGELETLLLGEPQFLDKLLQTPPHGLASFLLFTRRRMPALFQAAIDFLSDDKAVAPIVRTCLHTRPRLLPQLITICRKDIPKLGTALLRELQTPANVQQLVTNLIEGPLGDLAIFLREDGRHLPKVRVSLVRSLRDETTAQRVATRMLATNLGALQLLLEVTKTNNKELFEVVLEVLDTPEGINHLLREATKSDLRAILRFLQLVSERLPGVCEVLSAELTSLQNIESIVSRLIKAPITCMIDSVTLANCVLPSLGQSILQALNEPTNVTVLESKILSAPLDAIEYTIDFCRDHTPRLYEALLAKLAQPQVLAALNERSVEVPVSQLVAFSRLGDIAAPFFSSLDSRWIALKRETLSIETLPDLGRFVVALRQQGRPDLASEIAQEALLGSRDSEWRSGFMFQCLSSVLQAADPALEERIDNFLAYLCTPEWLRLQVQRASPGILAGALFRMWSALTPEQLLFFQVVCVKTAIHDHVDEAVSRPDDLQGLGTAISLIGVASLLGFGTDSATLDVLSLQPLDTILDLREPPSAKNSVTVGEIQLWLGIRVLANSNIRDIRVSSTRGSSFLRRLRTSDTTNERYIDLNRSLISWLENCANEGWSLRGF